MKNKCSCGIIHKRDCGIEDMYRNTRRGDKVISLFGVFLLELFLFGAGWYLCSFMMHYSVYMAFDIIERTYFYMYYGFFLQLVCLLLLAVGIWLLKRFFQIIGQAA